MDILARLNEKLSVYQSPRVNWLTKQHVLFKILGHTCTFLTFVLWSAINFWHTLVLTDWGYIDIIYLAAGVIYIGPCLSSLVYRQFEKRRYPKQKKVIEWYANAILQTFSDNEYHKIKIDLLKILNSEPYTPVDFLDQMLDLKKDHDWRLQQEEGKKVVSLSIKDISSLTVFIEKMEEQVNKEEINNQTVREKHMKSISKL